MDNQQLPHGFISIDEAVKLIKKDSREHPTVDIDRMISGIPYLREDGNFNIFLLEDLGDGKAKAGGVVPTYIPGSYELELLKKTLIDQKKLETGVEIDPRTIGVSNTTTAVTDDDALGRSAAVRKDPNPMTKVGDDTVNNAYVTSNK